MNNYTVSFITYINYSVTAESEEEAMDIAETLLNQNCGYVDYDEVDVWKD